MKRDIKMDLPCYLNASLAESQTLTEFFPHVGVRVMGLFKESLQFGQLLQSKVSTTPSRFHFAATVVVVVVSRHNGGQMAGDWNLLIEQGRGRFAAVLDVFTWVTFDVDDHLVVRFGFRRAVRRVARSFHLMVGHQNGHDDLTQLNSPVAS